MCGIAKIKQEIEPKTISVGSYQTQKQNVQELVRSAQNVECVRKIAMCLF